jgi:FKBP-type peptidyl-prolyl cis-trans isomerase
VKRFLACSLLLALAGCGGGDDGTVTGPTGEITIEEITVGTGALAVIGDVVTVHYTLFLSNGTRIESSHDTGQPLQPFQTGVGAVIPGFDRGVLGMRVGGKRRVTVPPSLAYGSQARGPIPANSTLVFDIELVSILGK